ncbi:hypothetical protein CNYM01_02523 [Colletotrichum nymphaeae SA-01]|uniref:Uncharacterized protein n=1 Tax=Colletotrichum nymphaeae SA-01 TaxID=1460502 RepID=A0A135UQT9_9PEZI|nr:hypothetical protein CNYM01_02523 [Colletotrichum nymphaeae SA-01]
MSGPRLPRREEAGRAIKVLKVESSTWHIITASRTLSKAAPFNPIYHANQPTPLSFTRIPGSFFIIAKTSKSPFQLVLWDCLESQRQPSLLDAVQTTCGTPAASQSPDGTIKLTPLKFSTLRLALPVFPNNEKPTYQNRADTNHEYRQVDRIRDSISRPEHRAEDVWADDAAVP